uniref:Uncharacterized protein n=1 Tax=Glossina palpalis gambiensis TaxID=67801 RepID=A0A1B0AP62_9MUSC
MSLDDLLALKKRKDETMKIAFPESLLRRKICDLNPLIAFVIVNGYEKKKQAKKLHLPLRRISDSQLLKLLFKAYSITCTFKENPRRKNHLYTCIWCHMW